MTKGSIKIGGVDVKDIEQKKLMDTVSFVFQDSKLLKMSIYDNVRMGKKDATREEVMDALKNAQCEDIIEKLPNGIDTVIGSKGTYLSGGEAQRVSIARAMLKNAPILILDDSVSAVDTRTEKIILDNLKTTRAGKTTLLIAHRISTVEGMDKIVFLEDGRVEAVGTHDALYHSCPEYRRMVDLQRLEDETADSSDAVGTSDIADSVDAPEHASESVEKCEGGASHD